MNLPGTIFPSNWPTSIQLYVQTILTYFLIRLISITKASSPSPPPEIKFTLAIGLMLCYVYQALNSGHD